MNRYYPTRWPMAFSIFLITIFLTGCATTGINQGDLNIVSLEEEWQLGNQLERDIAQQMRLVNDRAAIAYINEIGQRIVNQTELRNAPWEFHIVDDDAINAFNIPGGHVYVNTGLIKAARNVSELAGVMAHEITHGVSRHGTEQLTKSYGISALAGVALGNNPAVYQQLLAQVAASGASAKFSRNAEREADRLGVRYMYAAGYNPEGMATMFETLFSQRKRQPSSVEQFFSSHPVTTSRIRDVRNQARSLGNKRGLITQDNQLQSIQRRLR